ncbi:MBL fold metallo-hydrolase [Cognatishimia maritima]|uniref:Glyoxylase, beta-lactamase superfamily II n=1 Tax=Cognatishimia maritima TaxID=870908 RepID=A0A1M5ILV1_9RHOB|nr:MBL fold metallo-hydrolase [Cognatishimia maritima]SHG29267.1 Glyoxylase, beta-lactamase superfamily II [Cognatishimia maritima]
MSGRSQENPPKVGQPVELETGLRAILAPNPSPMTYWGTNTYLLGAQRLTVIDPGPESAPHLKAILNAVQPDQTITQIVVTHSHKDHSPLAAVLQRETGAEIIGFGDSFAGRSDVMKALETTAEIGGGEGVDWNFAPDRTVADGDMIDVDGGKLRVIHTPGHMGNHICLAWRDACFTGDHIMGWASSLVSPPDGDLTDFMASCDRLSTTDWRVFYSGHGAPIHDPNARLDWLIAHRRSREMEILTQLRNGPATAEALARAIYVDVNPKLLRAAQRNVLAHLIDLAGRGLAATSQPFEMEAIFEAV